MKSKFHITLLSIAILCYSASLYAQKTKQKGGRTYPDSIAPVGIIKGLNDDQLLEVVQRQTFRYFWHGAHPVSGLAL
jgi:hypothetical protein